MNWLIILIAVVAVYVVGKIIHFRHIKHRITAIALILLLFFAYATFTSVIKSNSIDIKIPTGVFQAAKVYVSWLGLAFNNMKTLTGNVIHMDWFPNNQTRADFQENNPFNTLGP
jgi:hypothetical protein